MSFSLKPADRPQTVTWFEWLSILVVIAGLNFGEWLRWDALIWVPLSLWIILSISRRGSSIARWIFTALYAIGFLVGAYGLATNIIALADFTPASWVLNAASVAQLWLVWSADTSRWLASTKERRTELAT